MLAVGWGGDGGRGAGGVPGARVVPGRSSPEDLRAIRVPSRFVSAYSPPRSGCRGPVWIDGLRPRDAAGGTEAGPGGPRLAGRWPGVAPAPRSVLGAPSERAEAQFGVLLWWSAN